MSRAGRTAGGAVWSRMLNMQSVEEGILEGNVSSEDDWLDLLPNKAAYRYIYPHRQKVNLKITVCMFHSITME